MLIGSSHPQAQLPEPKNVTQKAPRSPESVLFDLHIKILRRSDRPQALGPEQENMTPKDTR